MMHFAALSLCCMGFALLAAAMPRTQRDVLGTRLSRRVNAILRVAGFGLLLVALAVLMLWQGFALGLVMFSGHTSLAAGLVHGGLIIGARRKAKMLQSG